jgi:hypothetical protein
LEYAVRRVQKHQDGLKLNGTHQPFANDDDGVIIVGGNIDIIQEHKSSIRRSKEVAVEANPEKTKYMLRSRYQKAGQAYCIQIANRFFKGVAELKCLATEVTDLKHSSK